MQALIELPYGEAISIGIHEFKPLKLYDHLPNQLSDILKTIMALKKDFIPDTNQKIIFVADYYFFKTWWQSYAFLEPPATYGNF